MALSSASPSSHFPEGDALPPPKRAEDYPLGKLLAGSHLPALDGPWIQYPDPVAQFLGHERPQRAWTADRHGRALDVLRSKEAGLGRAAPQDVHAVVGSNTQHPVGKRPAAVETGVALSGTDEDVLRGVLGHRLILETGRRMFA